MEEAKVEKQRRNMGGKSGPGVDSDKGGTGNPTHGFVT